MSNNTHGFAALHRTIYCLGFDLFNILFFIFICKVTKLVHIKSAALRMMTIGKRLEGYYFDWPLKHFCNHVLLLTSEENLKVLLTLT